MNSKLVLLLFAVCLIQGIQSFCIYNRLTDGSTFDVTQRHSPTAEARRFKKHMGPDSRECCPYTTWDCSARQINYDYVYFTFFFQWPRFNSNAFVAKCFSGGALTIYGNENDHWAECTDATGKVVRVELVAANEQ